MEKAAFLSGRLVFPVAGVRAVMDGKVALLSSGAGRRA